MSFARTWLPLRWSALSAFLVMAAGCALPTAGESSAGKSPTAASANTAIVFYGVVWNQFDETVANAEIIARILRDEGGHPVESELRLHTDAEGRFALRDITGHRLTVEVRAEGYFPTRPSVFDYGPGTGHSLHGADPDEPVVLTILAR